jgi:hypothetical protein
MRHKGRVGPDTGAIAWANHLRILAALKAAEAKPELPDLLGRRVAGGSTAIPQASHLAAGLRSL